MADKQRAYDTRKNTDLFADDDPLAELARIVGFEPRVAANTVEDAPRQEPAFNLEDELLREFDRYEGKGVPDGKVSLSFRLTFQSPERTLTDDDVQAAMQRIIDALTRDLQAVQR